MYIEEQVKTMSQQTVEKPFGWLICFGDRPLQVTPPDGHGAHLLLYTTQSGAAAFIASRQQTFGSEPLSSLELPSAGALKDMTILPSSDPRYVAPPCGVVLDFNPATGASRTIIPPTTIGDKLPAELARELGVAPAPMAGLGPVISQPKPASSRRTATIVLVSLGGVVCLFLCVVLVAAGAVGMKNGSLPSFGLFTTPTFTPLPTLTPTPTPLPTPTTPPILWDVNLTDDFSSNVNNWDVYTDNQTDFLKDSVGIQDGVLHWQMQALKGVFSWNYPKDVAAVGDFDAAVDVQQIQGSDLSDYGLIFRLLDKNNYYMFVVDEADQEFAVESYENGWTTEVDWTTSKMIYTGQVNRLGVSARGNHFVFFINGTVVAETNISGISIGNVGVATDLYNAGDTQTVNFDNFMLQGLTH
jgi:hypothetical protein